MSEDHSHAKLEQVIKELNSFKDLLREIKQRDIIYTSPFAGSLKSFIIKEAVQTYKQIFVLLPNIQSVAELNVELDILGVSKFIISINEYKAESIQEKLTDITTKDKFILITSYDILNCALPARDRLKKNTLKLQTGGDLKYDDLIEFLNLLNYQKDRFVEAPGYYSQRGSIIDYWSYSEKNPVRLEFDGDFLESIRYFDYESQRSTEKIETSTLAGSLSGDESNLSMNQAVIFDYLDNPLVIASEYELKNLKKEKINFFEETSVTKNVSEDELMTEDNDYPDVPEVEEAAIESNEESSTKSAFDVSEIKNTKWIVEEELSSNNQRINIGFTEAPTINSNYEVLFNVLKNFSEENYNIFITSENELQSSRLQDLLVEYNEDLARLLESRKVKIETLAIKQGFIHKESKLLILSDYQIFGKPYRTKISTNKKYKRSKSKAIAAIKKGDYVVHEDFGIGKYVGLETIKIGDANQESMKIIYDQGGVVYVNLNYLALVKKYSSNENLVPTLSTLGTNEWSNTKHKTKKKIKEAAKELIELYAKRKATKGLKFNRDTVWQKELEASFFYEDTPDQEKVTKEVKEDMQAENPMDRLVCGDVGFGKTEIAVRAAFKAAQDGKQVAVLVPTTILAEQHFNTFNDRLSQFPVKIAVLSRFQTKKQQTEILQNLNAGIVDIIIGTHRLISKDVVFKDLGLLIIDEEHRFGVMAKEKLRSLKLNVDTLTLTATPIPRTLNLSLLGARDLSIIATPPPNRQPVYTHVSTFDIFKIKEWVLSEIRRDGQVYLVHDRVQTINKLAGYLERYVPEVKTAIAHGQMKPQQLEKVIHGFLNKQYDVLISTKIIESGMDIPNANTIIVNRADRFGLSELHQLRGRVGRSNRQAYAYFIVPSLEGISKKALRRLQAIEEFTDVGAGFNISMRDLEIRGAGNLLGTEQTGFINDVGFDLYVKLINEAVEELKYGEFKEVFKDLPKQEDRTEPTIDSYFEIGIPPAYMPEQMDRLNFYTALYSIKSVEEISDLEEEMIDRFGPLPLLVKRLIAAATLKFYASFALFERVIIQRKNITLILPRGEKEEYYKFHFLELLRYIMDEHKNDVKFVQQKENSVRRKDIMKLIITNKFDSPETLLEYLISFCKEVIDLFGIKIKSAVSEELNN